jgi:hypothetical protein
VARRTARKTDAAAETAKAPYGFNGLVMSNRGRNAASRSRPNPASQLRLKAASFNSDKRKR